MTAEGLGILFLSPEILRLIIAHMRVCTADWTQGDVKVLCATAHACPGLLAIVEEVAERWSGQRLESGHSFRRMCGYMLGEPQRNIVAGFGTSIAEPLSGMIEACAVMEGRYIVCAYRDGLLRVVDVVTCEVVYLLHPHTGRIRVILVRKQPMGWRITSGGVDQSVIVTDLTGDAGNWTHSSQVLSGHSGVVRSLEYLPDGRVVSGSQDRSVRVWDIANGTCLRELIGHSGTVWGVLQLVVAGCLLSISSSDLVIRMWDVDTGQCTQILSGHTGHVTCMLELSDGNLASGCRDSSVRVWQISAHGCVCTRVFKGFGQVTCIVQLPGRLVGGFGWECTIYVWETTTGSLLRCVYTESHNICAMLALADGRIMSGGSNGSMQMFDPTTNTVQELEAIHGAVVALSYLCDRRILTAGQLDINLWE